MRRRPAQATGKTNRPPKEALWLPSGAGFLCGGLSRPPALLRSPAHAHPIVLAQANSAHCAASRAGTPHAKRGVRILWRHRSMAARAPGRTARQRQRQKRRLPDAKTAQRRLGLVDGKGKKRGGVGAGQVQAKARRAAQHGQPAARAAACAVHERRQHSDMQRQPDQRMSQRQRAGLAQAAPPKGAGSQHPRRASGDDHEPCKRGQCPHGSSGPGCTQGEGGGVDRQIINHDGKHVRPPFFHRMRPRAARFAPRAAHQAGLFSGPTGTIMRA